MRTHDQMNDKNWARSKALVNLQRTKGKSLKLLAWLRKTAGFLVASCGSACQPVIEWVEDQDWIIANEVLDGHFLLVGAEPVEDLQEKSEQVHVALLALTEK